MKKMMFIIFICLSYVAVAQQARMVMDISEGSSSTFDEGEVIQYGFDDKVLFTRSLGDQDREFWVSDGTADGTNKLFDYSSPSIIREFDDNGDELIFLFRDSGVYYLASLDKITLDTTLLVANSEFMNELTKFNGAYFYNMNDDLWKYDLATNEQELIYEFEGFFGLKRIGVYNSQLILIAGENDGVYLFSSDGTKAGTISYYFIYSGSSIADYNEYFTQSGNLLYFFYYKPSDGKYSLYCTDGTQAGTIKLIDLETPSGFVNLEEKREIAAWNNKLLFRAAPESGSSFDELYVSDGTINGTHIIDTDDDPDNEGKPSYFTKYKGELYFSGAYKSPWIARMYKTDGTQQGTKFLEFSSISSIGAVGITVFNDSLCFSAYKSWHGDEFAFATGTDNSERFVDVLPDEDYSSANSFVATDKYLFFSGKTTEHGRELWVYDPDTVLVGTNELLIQPLSLSPNPCSDILSINSGSNRFDDFSIYFYSSDGKLVLKKPYEELNNIESLEPGMYKVVICTKNGVFADWIRKK